MLYSEWLRHSWGVKPEQKKREKEYNHAYYLANKNKWRQYAENARSRYESDKTSLRKKAKGAERLLNVRKSDYEKTKNIYDNAKQQYDSAVKSGVFKTPKDIENAEKKLKTLKNNLDSAEQQYRAASNFYTGYLKQLRDIETQNQNDNRRAEIANDAYEKYEASEAGQSEAYKRELSRLKNIRDKNWERYSRYESAAVTPDEQKEIDAGTWTREKYLSGHAGAQKAEDEALDAERKIKALQSKRRASQMAANELARQTKSATNYRRNEEAFANNAKQRRAEIIRANAGVVSARKQINDLQKQIQNNTIKLRSVSGAGGDARLKTSLENAIKYAKQQLEVAERTLKENQTKLRNLS